MKPITNYIDVAEKVNFYTLVEAARRQGQVAVGYRISAQARDETQTFGIHLNPHKSEMVRYCDKDSLIVIAEN
jgi:hypothetical protein